MARRSGPTLYEAMSRSAAGNQPAAKSGRRGPTSDPDRPATPLMLTPGSMVRLPVGYVWVLVGVAVLAVVVSFLWGHSRGEDSARKALEATMVARDRAAEDVARVREPSATVNSSETAGSAGRTPLGGSGSSSGRSSASSSGPGDGSGVGRGGEGRAPRTRGGLPPMPPGGAVQVDGRSLPAVQADRRESGKTYYQLITTRYDDAVETAEVVRAAVADLGLDAQVVRGENGRLASVILLPGFERRSSTEAERGHWDQRMRILRSRVAGKLKFSGEQPFADAFLVLHR